MGKKKSKAPKSGFLKSTLGIGLIVIAVVLVMVIKGITTQPDISKNKETIAEIEQKIEDEKKHQAEVDRMIENKDSDEYAEMVARDDLGMVKQDEIVFYDVSEK